MNLLRKPATVLDIDGVLADVTHRIHLVASAPRRWGEFVYAADEDSLIPEGARIASDALRDGNLLVLVTGRPCCVRKITVDWLDSNGIHADELHMRAAGDRRPARTLKADFVREICRRFDIVKYVDDDPDVVRAIEAMRSSVPIGEVVLFINSTSKAVHVGQEIEGRT
ncbi:hypothetical protein NSA19_08920 [Actinomyces bowdenii]|uniref:phosphatase domain-containing protein n=1 Tax=Actinomyces bowdenii TaxID=131109 RepID=UPI00214B3231|nr:hypothetical protein [Actinomyces bowdenii]MCR2052959.1 hypothetical protein [Actinomyces bowdenii]